MKALIDSDIWTDPNFEVLSMEAKLIVFWLWTAPGRDSAGVVRFSERRLANDTGIDKPGDALREAMESGSYICVSDGAGVVVWLGGWIEKQVGAGESLKRNNMFKPVQRAAMKAPDKIQKQIFKRYPELSPSPSEAPLEGLTKPQGRGGEGLDINNSYYPTYESTQSSDASDPNEKALSHNEFVNALAAAYSTSPDKVSPEGRRILWQRDITKDEKERVLRFVTFHRKGRLKDEPGIATTASRALIGIHDLIERAFAADLPEPRNKKPRVMKERPEPEPIDEATREEIKQGLAALKQKLKH